jgi:hypothetical protein
VNHTHKTAGHLIETFLARKHIADSVVTLGGTGPNGTSQLALLELIGFNNVQALKTINLISGSAFGYFIYLAFKSGKMHVEHYLDYDKGTRILHRASLIKAASFFCGLKWGRASLYENHRVKAAVYYLIHEDFCERELGSFNTNMVFWAYCGKRRDLVKISPATFPHMKVWEVITACLSIRSIHAHFNYQDYEFSDPMFSPLFKTLVRRLLRGGENHLFINYKKSLVSGNITFIKSQPCRFPNLVLLRDFLTFTCNMKNPRLVNTHRQNVELLVNSCRSE